MIPHRPLIILVLSSNGQDAALSRRKRGFKSLRDYSSLLRILIMLCGEIGSRTLLLIKRRKTCWFKPNQSSIRFQNYLKSYKTKCWTNFGGFLPFHLWAPENRRNKVWCFYRGIVEKYNSAFGTQRRGGSTFYPDWRILVKLQPILHTSVKGNKLSYCIVRENGVSWSARMSEEHKVSVQF